MTNSACVPITGLLSSSRPSFCRTAAHRRQASQARGEQYAKTDLA